MNQYSEPITECPNCGRLFNVPVNHGQCPACQTEVESQL